MQLKKEFIFRSWKKNYDIPMYFYCAVIKYSIALKTGNKSGLHYARTVIAQYQQFYNVLSVFEIATRKNSKSL